MRFLCYGGCVHAAGIDPALQCTASHRSEVVAADIDLVAFHEAPDFEVEAEDFAVAVAVDADGGHQRFGGALVIFQIPPVARYSRQVVAALRGVEFKEAVGLEVEGFGVVGG